MEFLKGAQQRELIGGGTFGELWAIKLNKDSPIFAQKISRKVTDITGIHTEVLFLSKLVSKYIPKLVYSGYTPDDKWCTIMQYFTGGTLDYHIEEEIKRKQANEELKINPRHKHYIAFHLACAIEYIHSKRFTHGQAYFFFIFGCNFLVFSDLKPNNIVLTKDGHVRLIDFGLARYVTNEEIRILPRQVAHYSSPEVWNKKPAGLVSDWWPYGVIIAYLYQLRLPFEGNTKDDIQKCAQSGQPFLDDMPHQQIDYVKDFIKKLLVVEPADRLSKVSENEFFGSNGDRVTPLQFRPGVVKIPVVTSSREAKFDTDDPTYYEKLEGHVVRIPSQEYLESEYFKSL